MEQGSLKERLGRIDEMTSSWMLERPHQLMCAYRIEERDWKAFRTAVLRYVSRALHLDTELVGDDQVASLTLESTDLQNVTPNGAVVPKKEYSLEFNMILRSWTEICRKMTSRRPELLQAFRITPNVRIKFGQDQKENIQRPLNTAIVHSDAWVEGPWGLNCFLPIAGDTKNNTLEFWETESFEERFLSMSESYLDMDWVLEHYRPMPDLIPSQGMVHLSDYALLHKTALNPGCGTRVSIDTTLMVGKHELAVRQDEYVKQIPRIGTDSFMAVARSEGDAIESNKSAFQHYSQGSMKLITLMDPQGH